MIEAKNLSFTYKCGRRILRDVSLSLEAGKVLAVLGNNGAGKTTLIKCLDKILKPTEGYVAVCGKDVSLMDGNEAARNMAYAAQSPEAADMTVFDAVLLGRKPYIRFSPGSEDMEIAEKAIVRMGLKDLELRLTSQLSGGELQKVAIARALAQQPRVLLLDEPTSSLDLYNQHEVMRTARDIACLDNIAVIIIIHDINLALRYCDRFLLLKDGTVYARGGDEVITPENIREVYRIRAAVKETEYGKMVFVE